MNADATHRLIAALADADQRCVNVSALAEHVGAQAVFVFAPDHDANGKLIPAPGFPATMPSSRGWRQLLSRALTHGTHCADVAFPTAAHDTPAVAYSYPGVTYVVIGPRGSNQQLADQLAVTAPLVAAAIRAESTAVFARGEIEIARLVAERAAALTRALDRARIEAERATRVKDEFLAMLGHELRNPLAPIVTAVQMLRLEGVSSKVQGVLERQVANVQRLVDDLLDVARITRGKVELRKERVEAAAVVQRALEMSRPLLEQRRSEVVVDVAECGLAIDGDPARLAQVMANLITNAAKYSDPGKQIVIRAERADTMIRIEVVDQGIGIDPSLINGVFESFTQIAHGGLDRAHGGLGLGLAIVRNLVDLHGGNVRAFSEGDLRGSQFIVELPALALLLEPGPASTPAPPPHAASGMRVLVVDDNSDAADLLGELLADHGHSVHVAHSGPEALQLLATFTPDAALLDIGLPVMDGYELALALRGSVPTIRLIALTGYGAPNDRKRTAEAGFDAHLTKPVSLSTVTSTLDALLGS